MKLFDLHNDFLTNIQSNKKQANYIYKNQSTDFAMTLWTSKLSKENLDQLLHRAKFLIKNCPHQLYFAIEDFGFVTPRYYSEVKSLKPLYIGLTWNHDNALAGGAFGTGNLTKLGYLYIRRLNADNIAIDTAHLNERSFMQVLREADHVLCSHTAFSGVVSHKRNLKDYQISSLIDQNGIIGLCAVPEFLSVTGKATINDFVSHIEYFLDKFGDTSLAIGSDFNGTKSLPRGLKKYEDFETVKKLLTKKGYSQETIAKIFYENVQKFYLSLTLSAD